MENHASATSKVFVSNGSMQPNAPPPLPAWPAPGNCVTSSSMSFCAAFSPPSPVMLNILLHPPNAPVDPQALREENNEEIGGAADE